MPTVPSTSHSVLPKLSTLEFATRPLGVGLWWVNRTPRVLALALRMRTFPITAHPIIFRRLPLRSISTGQLTWVKLRLTLI